MSTINSTNAYEDLGLTQRQQPQKPNDSLGQAEFLRLMTTQLANQDPLQPIQDADFIAQMAQFGTVNGITELQSSFDTLASAMQSNQALQASVMVGRTVTTPSDINTLSDSGEMTGMVNLPSNAQNVIVKISKPNGELVQTLHLGEQAAGLNHYTWDGTLENNDQAEPGTYVISAQMTNGEQSEAVQAFANDTVDSVSLGGPGGFTLHLSNLGDRSMNDILKIS